MFPGLKRRGDTHVVGLREASVATLPPKSHVRGMCLSHTHTRTHRYTHTYTRTHTIPPDNAHNLDHTTQNPLVQHAYIDLQDMQHTTETHIYHHCFVLHSFDVHTRVAVMWGYPVL